MTSVSMTVVTDPSSVNTESAGIEDAESSQGGKPAQPEPGKDLTAEEEALLGQVAAYSTVRFRVPRRTRGIPGAAVGRCARACGPGLLDSNIPSHGRQARPVEL